MIHHHHIGPKPVQFGVTSKKGVLNQSRNLRFTEPSGAGRSLVQDGINFDEKFLVLVKLKFCDLFSGASGFFYFTLN